MVVKKEELQISSALGRNFTVNQNSLQLLANDELLCLSSS